VTCFSTSNYQRTLLSQKNPTTRTFRISGWFAVPINQDKWSSTVPPTAILLNQVSGNPASYSTSSRLICRPGNCIIRIFVYVSQYLHKTSEEYLKSTASASHYSLITTNNRYLIVRTIGSTFTECSVQHFMVYQRYWRSAMIRLRAD
jgi:hypothetical protein